MIRYIAVSFFLLATIFCFLIDESKICVHGLFSSTELTYIQQIDGTASDDASAFLLASLLNIIFLILFSATTNKKIYFGFLLSYLLLSYLSINLMLSIASVKDIVIDTVFICHDYGMTLWLTSLILFLTFSLVFLFKKKA